MTNIEERVAYLEGRVVEQGQMVNGVREALASLEARMDRRFEQVERRFDQMDGRFLQLEQRVETRAVALGRRFDDRFSDLDTKVGRLTGLMIATLLSIIAGTAALVTAILQR